MGNVKEENLSSLETDTSLSNICKSMGDVKEENLSSLGMNTSLSPNRKKGGNKNG